MPFTVIGAALVAGATVYSASTAAGIATDQIGVANNAEARLTRTATIADSWATLLHDRYTNKYIPVEDQWLDKALNLDAYKPRYETAINRTAAAVRASFSDARRKIRDCGTVYCVGSSCGQERQLAMIEAAALADTQNAAIRIEDARKEAFDERDYARATNAVNLGRLFQADAKASSDASARIWENIAKAAGQSASGSLKTIGSSLADLGKIASSAFKTQAPASDAGISDTERVLAAIARDGVNTSASQDYTIPDGTNALFGGGGTPGGDY